MYNKDFTYRRIHLRHVLDCTLHGAFGRVFGRFQRCQGFVQDTPRFNELRGHFPDIRHLLGQVIAFALNAVVLSMHGRGGSLKKKNIFF
jgi:hypothetical protein